MNRIAEDILMHYGMPRRSGRYPWGSGEHPYQRTGDFISRYNSLKNDGLSERQIAEELGIVNEYGVPSVTKLRAQYSIAKNQRRQLEVDRAKSLRDDGLGNSEIARKMSEELGRDINESTVRSWFNSEAEARTKEAKVVADYLKNIVDEKGMLDVGSGVERELGISETKLQQALYSLEMEGYVVYGGRIPQVTNPGQQTTQKVLCPPGTEHSEIYNYENIHSVHEYDKILTEDGTKIRKRFEYPASMDSSRLMIRYGDEGGSDKDGVIEIRRGVDDLSLGDSHYAQVRILVDNDHYIKGMAVYSDDLPPGVDIIFNTNKKSGTDKMDVLKPISKDPNNPFGALIKENGGQSYYIDPKTGEERLSLINKRAEEGDWGDWSDSLPSQFLAKQNLQLVSRQLNLAKIRKETELDEIISLNNPTIKRKMLDSFAEDCDSAAVHLQAAALPGQRWQVILPVTSIGDKEVYAPNFKNGEKVALVRYPHGGTFEIPILTVNNKQKEGKDTVGPNSKDAIGINSKVAARLSGADFDGDTVMVIPIKSNYKITSTPPLKELENFDPKMTYGGKKEGTFKPMKNTQTEMGKISNLIADMTIKGASPDELARAVKHSMVVIDAEKHKLDYKASYIDNGIKALEQKYQPKENGRSGGASTLITKAKSEQSVTKRQGQPIINEDGSLTYKDNPDAYYIDPKTGKTKTRTEKSTKMKETSDAYSLSSGTKVESLYADYANSMKALANKARKEEISTGRLGYSKSASNVYAKEVDSLNSKLNNSLKNAPKEREAQRRANIEIEKRKKEYESSEGRPMPKKEEKKVAQQKLTESRNRVGAERQRIIIEPREWEAIQSGAISDSKLMKIINFVDDDTLKSLATPRSTGKLSNSQISRIKRMSANGYTNAEIAESLHISEATVSNYQ